MTREQYLKYYDIGYRDGEKGKPKRKYKTAFRQERYDDGFANGTKARNWEPGGVSTRGYHPGGVPISAQFPED